MKKDNANQAKSLATLAGQGQSWKLAQEAIAFKRPAPLFDRPMEITIQKLRGLRMVDETIVVHGTPRDLEKKGSNK